MLSLGLFVAGGIKELHHTSEILLGVHIEAMATSVNGIKLRLDTSILKGHRELLSLTEGNDIILRAMENDDGRIVLVQIRGNTQRAVFPTTPVLGKDSSSWPFRSPYGADPRGPTSRQPH